MRDSADTARYLDIAIKVVLVCVALALAVFVYVMVSSQIRERNSGPAAQVVANLTEVVRQDPNNVTARLRLADALASAGRIRDAQEQYQLVLEISEDDPGALAGLAQIAMNQGEWRTAEGYWRRILDVIGTGDFASIDQRVEKAYYYLGSTLMELNEYEEAASYLREALRIRNDASDTYFLLAIAYREMDSPAKFRENLELALRFDPLLPEANYELGLVLLEEGDEAAAAERFRVSADNAPPDRTEPQEALAEFGDAEERAATASRLYAEGDLEGALTEARIASALDPDDVESTRLVAQIYEKQEKLPEARAAWERVLTLQPGDEEAREAISRLGGAPK